MEFIPADDEKGPGLRLKHKLRGKRVKRAGMRGKSAYAELKPAPLWQAIPYKLEGSASLSQPLARPSQSHGGGPRYLRGRTFPINAVAEC